MYVEYHWDNESGERFILVKDEKTNEIIRVLPGDFPLDDALDPSKWPPKKQG